MGKDNVVVEDLVARAEGAVVATDGVNRIVEWNKAADELLHLRGRGARQGDLFFETIEARDSFGNRLPEGEKSFLGMIECGEPVQGFEILATDGDGGRHKLAVLPVVVLGHRRRESSVVYFLRPILRRRRADEVIERFLSTNQHGDLDLDALRGADGPGASGLTDRQLEVLKMMADGAAVGDMAAQLGVSVNTVRSHISNILQRLKVHSRVQAVSLALREGWI